MSKYKIHKERTMPKKYPTPVRTIPADNLTGYPRTIDPHYWRKAVGLIINHTPNGTITQATFHGATISTNRAAAVTGTITIDKDHTITIENLNTQKLFTRQRLERTIKQRIKSRGLDYQTPHYYNPWDLAKTLKPYTQKHVTNHYITTIGGSIKISTAPTKTPGLHTITALLEPHDKAPIWHCIYLTPNDFKNNAEPAARKIEKELSHY